MSKHKNSIMSFRDLTEKEIESYKRMPPGTTTEPGMIRNVTAASGLKQILEITSDRINRIIVDLETEGDDDAT